MKRQFLRSTLFNLSFYGATALACIACIPTLFLPRCAFLTIVDLWLHSVAFLEEHILGLTYEVRGIEHLPKDGSFIVAAKHQSPYETFKLRLILDDPAVILKQELLRIPLWGAYLKKSDVIAIDRSTPKIALESIKAGALRVKEQGRPIVIFPQGTRVLPDATTKDKPYKSGVYNIQNATKLPIIPLALNSGVFWPRKSWLKSSGVVTFEFLKPIKPGTPKKELMSVLEHRTESASNKLMDEARKTASSVQKAQKAQKAQEEELSSDKEQKRFALSLFVFAAAVLLLLGGYSYAWFKTAQGAQMAYMDWIENFDMQGSERDYTLPVISGFPGPITLHVEREIFMSPTGSLEIKDIRAQGWPFPSWPVRITSGPLELKSIMWGTALIFDGAYATLKFSRDLLTIEDSALKRAEFIARVEGTIDLAQTPIPKLDLNVRLENHPVFLAYLAENEIIKKQAALFMGAGLSTFTDESGTINVPITQNKYTLYVGPFPIAKIPQQMAE